MEAPIFLFSLPRTGSTLLQRLLMAHSEIASTAEPWFLLPAFCARKLEGTVSAYSHWTSYHAIEDFVEKLPRKEADYRQAVGKMAMDLYQKQCHRGERYFLDKTPRYHLIIPEIVETFPDARLIFLFRNPVHTIASQIKTFCNNRLGPFHRFQIDVRKGFDNLSQGYEKYQSRAIMVNYESLVQDTEGEMRRIFSYLGLSWDARVLHSFQDQLIQLKDQRMGDPTGRKAYKTVSKVSLYKWRETMCTPIRKQFLKQQIESINADALAVQGYDKAEIIKEVNSLHVPLAKGVIKDSLDLLYSRLLTTFNLNLILDRSDIKWARKWYLN